MYSITSKVSIASSMMSITGNAIRDFNISTISLVVAVVSAIIATVYHRRQREGMIKTRILGSTIIVMSLCFIIMICWYVTQPAVMSIILTLQGNVPAEGNNVVTLLQLAVNFWGVIAIVVLLVTYGIMQAQRRDYRGEYYQ